MNTPLKRFWHFIKRENLDRLTLIAVLLIGGSGLVFYLLEPEVGLIESLWWSIVTLTTVGYGDISPTTLGGKVVAIVIMVVGIGVLGTLSGILASVLVDRKLKAERGLMTHKLNKHIILCEWNVRAENVYRELRLDPQHAETPIVLIARLERKPLDDDNFYFVHGQVNDHTLKQANLSQASTVVVLGDDTMPEDERDAKVVLATLTIESLNPDVYSIVELTSEANVKHCQRAQANEIIVNSELSSGLISRAAANHGISNVITEWLSSTHGDEIYKLAAPERFVGQPFLKLFTELKQAHRSTVLAIQQGEDGPVVSNPKAEYQIARQDYLILVAENKPSL
jgi:voltage-gated potassium channel